ADLQRVQDELRLRLAGLSSPRSSLLAADRGIVSAALVAVPGQLQRMSGGAAAPPTPPPQEAGGQKGGPAALLSACSKCHPTESGSLTKVSAARPVLVRSTFVHAPHLLQADCSRCHAGVEKSKLSKDLNFKGIASCRECHGSGRAKQDCQSC